MIKIIRVNNSEKKPNWTQIKNKYEPFATCNVAACVNGAQSANWDVLGARSMGEKRPADDLYAFIHADGPCRSLYRALDPDEAYPINQWMPVLALGLARWLGHPVPFKFDNNANPSIMAQWIIEGGSCVVSGHYPAINTNGTVSPIDHITALVGVGYRDIPGAIDIAYWIMDDSYGDYRTKYESRMGNDIEMSPNDFNLYLKSQGSVTKRCIFIPKKGASREN